MYTIIPKSRQQSPCACWLGMSSGFMYHEQSWTHWARSVNKSIFILIWPQTYRTPCRWCCSTYLWDKRTVSGVELQQFVAAGCHQKRLCVVVRILDLSGRVDASTVTAPSHRRDVNTQHLGCHNMSDQSCDPAVVMWHCSSHVTLQ